MKRHLLILLVLISQNGIGQMKFGTVEYKQITGKEIVDRNNANSDKNMKDWFTKVAIAAESITYTLNFNTNEACFFANPILMNSDGIDFNLAATTGRGVLKYYQNNVTKEFRKYNDSKRTGIVIVNNEQKYEWTLVNESKIIDGYKCYKATTPLYLDGVRKESYVFTAWYTPEIPVSFGPIGYGGLPGLILELQNDRATFFAKKINLALDKEPEIEKLLSPKSVSKEIYMMMVMGTFSKEQLEGMKEVEDKQK